MSSGKFKELKEFLKALPQTLPISGLTFNLNRLLQFALDKEWIKDVGIEGVLIVGLRWPFMIFCLGISDCHG